MAVTMTVMPGFGVALGVPELELLGWRLQVELREQLR